MTFSCVNCRNNRAREISGTVSRHVAGHEFHGTLPALECTSCGMKYYQSDDLAHFELATAISIGNAALMTPEALRFMRKVTGLQAKQFAGLLGVRAETVSRWESGKVPVDRATYALLQQVLVDRLAGSSATEKGLRLLMHPGKLTKRVRADDVPLAKILDRISDADGPRYMGDVGRYWIDRLIERRFLKPLAASTAGRRYDVTDAGRAFADKILNRRRAA